ncbi:hypothetical protein [Pseudalkalibacillus decolorationis]|uniref:hypothetical protein n=1 Tax=Pseudalkalibacillus decolorationis TaxID=163879 RepID=UPI002147FB29|nr:hypothetical protein [Pseudalkalibacillus decolorationis]
MKFGLIKWVAVLVVTVFAYQNRYRLLNMILGMRLLRTVAVRGLMRIPGIRGKMVQDLF